VSGRSVGRRDVAAGGISMLVLAAAAAAQAKAQELDGELLALCAEFQAVEDESDCLGKKYAVVDSSSLEGGRLQAEQDVLVSRIYELREAISDLPPRTPEGIKAKTRVTFHDLSPNEEWPEYAEAWMTFSVLRDILGRAG
jgi:hypothetical protein